MRFLESGLIGRHAIRQEDLDKAAESIEEAGQGIRQGNFEAHPAYLACAYCAYNQICPSSISGAR
jgi:CRISPR/Cas system-associated exonuclease Cas4 (RecB family)